MSGAIVVVLGAGWSGLEAHVAGTWFTVDGVTLTSSHVLEGAFNSVPEATYRRVIIGGEGDYEILEWSDVEMYPGLDVARIHNFTGRHSFARASTNAPASIRTEGFSAANGRPLFEVVEPAPLKLNSGDWSAGLVRTRASAETLRQTVSHGDGSVLDAPGWWFDCDGLRGMSGGPAIDVASGQVVGVTIWGIPEDVEQKEAMFAVDLRTLPPFIGD